MKFFFTLVLSILSLNVVADLDLEDKMRQADHDLFDSFNKCADKNELEKHRSFFAQDIEFYHDNGGVTWDRASMIVNTKNNVCGNFYRKLLPESFQVFPIKSFGAITQGTHIFCSFDTDVCEGKADFTMIWQSLDDKYVVTRALSYGHRINP
ncbi:DUF4440 domain-containing protein [Brumicola blandensis]|uniref:DUF4440 domain-containing protein n=1 Tax=Brumicola blandensis TaxID=3075611 RepID=A0AAW8R2I4_9ALTE|nr:DUF4440 domain-containing protein [Alteromonas sp. W409]MDT0583638.1 DUF4440 domain-containing protein [Alteromonas sp. W409]